MTFIPKTDFGFASLAEAGEVFCASKERMHIYIKMEYLQPKNGKIPFNYSYLSAILIEKKTN